MTSTVTSARVMTNCPLCGFRQRIDRLTGLEFQVKDMENDLLPLESILIYADKGREGFRSVRQPVSLPVELQQEMLLALAAKMLPLVRYLQLKVPEFREASTDVVEVLVVLGQGVKLDLDRQVVAAQGVKRDVERRMAPDVGVKFDRGGYESWRNVKRELGVPLISLESWPSVIENLRRKSEPLSPETLTRSDQPVPVKVPVEVPVSLGKRREPRVG